MAKIAKAFFDQVLVAGGGMLNVSFMAENLVDEIYFDFEINFMDLKSTYNRIAKDWGHAKI